MCVSVYTILDIQHSSHKCHLIVPHASVAWWVWLVKGKSQQKNDAPDQLSKERTLKYIFCSAI